MQISARLVSRPAAIPLSRVRARGPVYQHPAAVAAQPHGIALHSGAAAEQGGEIWGNPDPAAEMRRNISVGRTLFKKRRSDRCVLYV